MFKIVSYTFSFFVIVICFGCSKSQKENINLPFKLTPTDSIIQYYYYELKDQNISFSVPKGWINIKKIIKPDFVLVAFKDKKDTLTCTNFIVGVSDNQQFSLRTKFKHEFEIAKKNRGISNLKNGKIEIGKKEYYWMSFQNSTRDISEDIIFYYRDNPTKRMIVISFSTHVLDSVDYKFSCMYEVLRTLNVK